jgi:hypothetical protein
MPRRRWIALAAMALFAALALLAPALAADADTTPPSLRALSVEPAVVDVSTGDAAVTVTATVTDVGSGVSDGTVFVGFRSPSGNVFGAWLLRTAGDEFSGTLTMWAGPATPVRSTARPSSRSASPRRSRCVEPTTKM